ncbi:MAG TPA: glycosyl hydrolase [Ignavibacteriales bacterium]|nr:glycosyl hydrolase [Ignavibacteriales bacterium]
MAFSQKLVNGEKLTPESFRNPPKELGILPFWFWNGEMNEKEMEWQMKEYHDKGIPGLFIHGRFGEEIGYLSDKWFDRVKFAVEKAKEIGLDIWVYDEMNWPSGTAERQVIKKYPHLSQKYLELVALNVDGPLFTFLEATDSRYVNTGDSRPIAAFACSADEYKNGIKELIDLTPNLSFNKVIPWEAPAGKWKLLYFLEKEVPYYIDALNPESTNRFIELTHDRYKNAVGKDFGTIVPGFYTDEPAMHYYQVGVDNYVVPWSSQMFKIFRQRRGYDLRPYLPALYVNMGEVTSKIRYDFWRTLSEQYTDSYYRRLREWCDENGVIFTGHVLFEEWLRLQARCEGNIFKHLKQMHITGVDHLYPKIGTEKEPDQHVALKLASSAAHHYGSTRLLCESMGGAYWDCTLERMKWIANWEYVLGVNLFNNHGYHYSIEGERKRDWPPSQFYHHTWWNNYGEFTTYMSRLGHVLSGGRHVAKVLVLYPLNSIWTNYVPQKRNNVSKTIEDNFNFLTDSLLRLHYDYDYVDEDVLIGSKVAKDKIKIADEEYSLLILPPLTHIKKDTFQVIKKFVENGGRVIADTILPFEFLEAEGDGAAGEMKELFGVNPKDLFGQFKEGQEFRGLKSKKNVYLYGGKGRTKAERREDLGKLLNKTLVPDVVIDNEEVFYLHRVKDGYDIYFIVNTGQKEIGQVEISFEKTGSPELWDPASGEIKPLCVYQIKNGRTVVNLHFSESQSHIVIIRNSVKKPFIQETNLVVESFDGKKITGYLENSDKEAFAKVETNSGVKRLKAAQLKPLAPIRLGRTYNFDIKEDNALLIRSWKMKLEDESDSEGFSAPSFDDSEWLKVTNGAWEMQLPQERDNETYPVTLWYRTTFEIENMPEKLSLLIDGFSGKEHTLFINGQEIKDKGQRSYLDAEIKEIDISRFVHEGQNHVAVRLIAQRRTDGILDLLKITGKFALAKTEEGYKIVKKENKIKLGDWTKQGYPFFSGTGTYETEFRVPEDYKNGKFFLEVNLGEDVLEVSMNGHEGRVLPWHPYRLDVTDMVQTGNNTIQLKVTNTLINVLEAVQKKSGIFSEPVITFKPLYVISL